MTDQRFNIGDRVFYVYSSCNYEKEVSCSICFGKLFCDVVLGDGTVIKSECGHCKKGLSAPTGNETTWEPIAEIRSGEISGVSKEWDGLKYQINHSTFTPSELFRHKESAESVREERFKQEVERAEKNYKDNFKCRLENQIWDVGYHRDCIKSAEQTIEWHKMRLGMIKDKKKKSLDQL